MTQGRGDTFVFGESAQISFSTFVLGLASTALIHLGEQPDPEHQAVRVDLVLAQQTLDLLDMLQDKTRGNLSAEEERLIKSLLTDLKLKFVEMSRR